MELKDVPGELWLLTGGALGWLGKNGVLWFQRRRQSDAQADATVGEAWSKFQAGLYQDFERMRAIEAALRADFAEQNLKLRSVIYSLAKKIPLDPKQQAILASIAPDVPAT